ncbi:MAG: V-type ATP synthase subunit I, partial [Verrucomicrobiota bacterium]|nr:V-type ATP synthase subunit I [Verrucomicrobiota bacterium]
MIVKLAKYLIVGNQSDMDRFFVLAQRAGFIEFIGLSKKRALELPEDAKTILSAIKILRAHSSYSPTPFMTQLDPVPLASEIVAWNEELERLCEQERMLTLEMARVQAFGHFSRSELDGIEQEAKRVVQFFCMKSDLAREMTLPPEVIYVGTEYDLDYFVSINKEKTSYPKMIEIVIDKPVGELRDLLHQLRMDKASLEAKIHESAPGMSYLQNGLLTYLNEYHLKMAKHDAIHPVSSLFAIEAWVPCTKINALHGLMSNLDVFAEEIEIEARDKIPTCQENKGAAKIGEDLVHVYDIPAWNDKDPSLWVLIFFALFFALIVSDAGYGLIYLLIGLFLKFKYKKASGLLRRFIKLTMILSVSCIIWGVATASFFGLEIGPTNPLRKISFIDYLASKKAVYHLRMQDDVYQEYVKQFPDVAGAESAQAFFLATQTTREGKTIYQAQADFANDILLELALFIGLVHITLSFLRSIHRNWTGAGWICFMVGGYLYFPSFLGATSLVNFLGWVPKAVAYSLGANLLYAGLGLVFVIALLQKRKWGALHELTNAIQVFADVLSYLRLYALALAGMIMAATFNDLAVKAGILGGIAIVLVGHATNLSLTVMSGTIHG